MSVAPSPGIIDFGVFTAPTLSLDGIQGQVPIPLAGQQDYILTASGWVPNGGGGSGTVTSVDASGGSTGMSFTGGPVTTNGVLTLGGTLNVGSGGTGITTVPVNGALLIGNGTNYTSRNLTAGTGIGVANAAGSITVSNSAPMTYPAAGIANSTGSAWGTSYTTTGSGTVAVLAASPTITGTYTFGGTAVSAAAWTTNGIGLIQSATTYTDTTSTGTVANAYVNKFGAQTVAASSAVTYTSLVGTWYSYPAAGTNVTIGSNWALGADSILSTHPVNGGYIRSGQNTGGNISSTIDVFSSGTGTSYMRLLRGNSAWWGFYSNGSNDLEIGSGYLNYSASNIMPAMYLQRVSGNVGLSNISPAYRFDASGAIRGYGLLSSQVPSPSAPSGTPSTTGGTLAAATYYFKIVAIDGQGNSTAASAESTGVTTTGTTSSIALTWTRIAGVASYQVWYATASGAQANYYAVSVNQPGENYLTASFTFTAAAGTSGTIPTLNTTGLTSIAALTATGKITFGGVATSAPAWGTSGVGLIQSATTFTDNSTAASGTVATAYMNVFGAQTYAATNTAVTVSNLYGTYFTTPIAGTNVTATNKYALGADSIYSGGKITATGSTANAPLNIGSASAVPTTPVNGDIWYTAGGVLTTYFGGATRVLATLGGGNTWTSTNTFASANNSFGTSTASTTDTLSSGATTSGNTKTVNIGTGGLSGSTTNITIGSSVSGATSTTTLNGSTVATGTIQLAAYTVATLPTAGTAGRRAYVTDALAPTFLGTLTGGGTAKTPVFDNGTAWVAG